MRNERNKNEEHMYFLVNKNVENWSKTNIVVYECTQATYKKSIEINYHINGSKKIYINYIVIICYSYKTDIKYLKYKNFCVF